MNPTIFQDPMAPLPRSGEITQVPNYALVPNATDFRGMFPENLRAVMITWSFDGKQVAVTGSWDNWNRRYKKLLCFSLVQCSCMPFHLLPQSS